MNLTPADFWKWFYGFSARMSQDDPPEAVLDELLHQFHRYDDRIYFELATNSDVHELVITAGGDASVFAAVEALVSQAPSLAGWSFIALKPPRGFDFVHRDNGIELDASRLWFLPLTSAANPDALGLRIGLPDPDFIFQWQTVDTAYTILETGIGERSCARDIQYVEVEEAPADPASHGYLALRRLAEYIARREQKEGA